MASFAKLTGLTQKQGFLQRTKPDTQMQRPIPKGQRIPCEKLTFSRVRTLLTHPTVCQATVTASEEGKETKQLGDTQFFEIASEIYAIRSSCIERLKFEVEYGLKRGTTENAYLVKGNDRETTFLVDIPHPAFTTSFMLALQKVIPAKRIGSIFLTHLEPESVPVLSSLIRLINVDGNLPVSIRGTTAALRFFEDALEKEEDASNLRSLCNFEPVPLGSSMKLSDNMELEFIRTATPRWPDMMAIYLPKQRILFSSKFFSAHVTSELTEVKSTPFDVGGWHTYANDWQYFFETMLAPSITQVSKALKELRLTPAASGLSFDVVQGWFNQIQAWFRPQEKTEEEENNEMRSLVGICPTHGPVVRNALHELEENYAKWVKEQSQMKGSIAVFYASAYGNTAALAQAISHGINKTGFSVKTLNLELSGTEEVDAVMKDIDGFIIGSPTLGGHMPTQVQAALGTIVRNIEAKKLPCGVFGSFGWSGEAVDELQQRLKDAGFQFGFDPIKVKMKPTAKASSLLSFLFLKLSKDLQICEESGTDLAQIVEKQIRKRQKQNAGISTARTATGPAQAVGRIVGTLCVISGKDGDAESGMLASWVSQASFNPPGITISVKRDRAVENVLLVGSRFNVNILAEGKETDVVKHMLKPFKPGESRFEGLATEVCEETDCVVIHNAVSYLECTVKERMEAGDHWVIYATVEGGKVMDRDSQSAVHHRKVGTNY